MACLASVRKWDGHLWWIDAGAYSNGEEPLFVSLCLLKRGILKHLFIDTCTHASTDRHTSCNE